MQRMRMRLQNYNIQVTYVKGSSRFFADTLSRAHTSNVTPDDLYDNNISVAEINVSMDMVEKVKELTALDATLTKLKEMTLAGWPDSNKQIDPIMKPFYTFRNEITWAEGMLFKGTQIIIPKKLQHELLHKLHESHLGIIKCKQLARDTVFWVGLSSQLEDLIARCHICQEFRNDLHKEPLINHEIIDIPFYKVGVDLFHVDGENYLLIVDYYSKFPDMIKLTNMSSKEVIEALKQTFSRYGIPKYVVSDNGPQFASEEYKAFSASYEFVPIYTNPMHAQSNGQV